MHQTYVFSYGTPWIWPHIWKAHWKFQIVRSTMCFKCVILWYPDFSLIWNKLHNFDKNEFWEEKFGCEYKKSRNEYRDHHHLLFYWVFKMWQCDTFKFSYWACFLRHTLFFNFSFVRQLFCPQKDLRVWRILLFSFKVIYVFRKNLICFHCPIKKIEFFFPNYLLFVKHFEISNLYLQSQIQWKLLRGIEFPLWCVYISHPSIQ